MSLSIDFPQSSFFEFQIELSNSEDKCHFVLYSIVQTVINVEHEFYCVQFSHLDWDLEVKFDLIKITLSNSVINYIPYRFSFKVINRSTFNFLKACFFMSDDAIKSW